MSPQRGRLLTPVEILRLSADEADELLDELERWVPVRPTLVEIPGGSDEEAIVFGDTHGDWRSTEEAVKRFREGNRYLFGLGDYVDRAPEDCGAGSVANALYLLGLSASTPDRVYLVQGNHEAVRRIPAVPHDLPEEVDELWGPESLRYDRILGLLERGPLAVATRNGAYLAHAGFPQGRLTSRWRDAFAMPDDEHLAEILWAECDGSRIRRGASPPWGRAELDRFLDATGLRVVLRGHDPDVTGRSLYDGRCLTLHTSRIYEHYGGVIIGRFSLGAPLRSVAEVTVEHLPTEGRSYPNPD